VFTGDITLQPAFQKITRRMAQKFYPNTHHIMQNAFVLGVHQGLSNAQINYLTRQIEDFLGLHG